jgi:transcriptional regulator with XRE-family HTH domain
MGKYADNLASAVAAQLRAERGAADLTYKELAERAGLKEQSVMRYLTEKREPTVDQLGALCDALGLTPQELMVRAVERIK